jgi:hypothetical protein
MIKAEENDIDDVYNIFVECTHWLNNKGIKQWRKVYPKNRLINDIRIGVVYKFMKIKNIIGTVTLYKSQPEYYPDNIYKHQDNVLYLCRFAISRNSIYRELGASCMALIERYALSKEVDYLRLDVTKLNPFLENYYRKLSFSSVGEAEIFSECMLFMEKTILTHNFTRPPTSTGEF